jgi:hypothetical protein
MYADLTFSFAKAAAVSGYLSVQSRPERVSNFTAPFFDPRRHAVAVKLDFVDPLRPARGVLGELGKLGFDPAGKGHEFDMMGAFTGESNEGA